MAMAGYTNYGNESFGSVHFCCGEDRKGPFYGYVIMPPESYEKFLVDQKLHKVEPQISEYGEVIFVSHGSTEPSNVVRNMMEKTYGVDHITKIYLH